MEAICVLRVCLGGACILWGRWCWGFFDFSGKSGISKQIKGNPWFPLICSDIPDFPEKSKRPQHHRPHKMHAPPKQTLKTQIASIELTFGTGGYSQKLFFRCEKRYCRFPKMIHFVQDQLIGVSSFRSQLIRKQDRGRILGGFEFIDKPIGNVRISSRIFLSLIFRPLRVMGLPPNFQGLIAHTQSYIFRCRSPPNSSEKYFSMGG